MDLGRTTPEALEIEEFMSLCCREKAEYVVMEVSSHALDLHRVDEIQFNTAVYTNLTQDHLDYHQNMENYLQSKLKLFSLIGDKGYGIVNADRPLCIFVCRGCGTETAGPTEFIIRLRSELQDYRSI